MISDEIINEKKKYKIGAQGVKIQGCKSISPNSVLQSRTKERDKEKNRKTNLTLTEKKEREKINFHFHFLSTLSFFVKVRNSTGFKTAKLFRSFSASKAKFPTPPFFACPNGY